MPDSRARYIEGHWYLPVGDYHELRAELERERHDAWEALDGTNVKALELDGLRLRAALCWIHEYGSRDGDLLDKSEWLDAMRNIARNALDGGAAVNVKDLEAKVERLQEAGEALLHALTYDKDPRNYSAQFLAVVDEMGRALDGRVTT